MIQEVLFETDALPYRQKIPVYGFRFGGEEKTIAIMGAMRGDEFQQMYICAKLVRRLKELEEKGVISNRYGIQVIPTASQFSMNVGKRFWPVDNTDINRMFPGYDEGETTQRLAANIFKVLRGHRYGIQLASFYIPGEFLPHVRLMNTGYTKPDDGYLFGLPYLVMRTPKPYDTTTLNYNWQVFETDAFSVYTKATDKLDEESAKIAVESILRFMEKKNILKQADMGDGADTAFIPENEMSNIQTSTSGLFRPRAKAGDMINENDEIAEIICPYTAEVKEVIKAQCSGRVFFVRHAEAIMEHDLVYRIVPGQSDDI
ncbi:MAG: succinylglutamate desuccinylase/aspartoacylase family protein [Lachnospiraceae bacterium]|nr:succinylglutamate desuccinylase/aspartoacylase family protein [Lachnospiraceae bacterium]